MELDRIIFNSIKHKGYLTISEFMEIALTSYESSYYRDNNPLGENSDFITAPEASQMFGEMIALWIYSEWNRMGCKKIRILELGAGTGILMRDILNILSKTEMRLKYEIFILDICEKLIEKQKETLNKHKNINWISDISELPKKKFICVANEFFDALPINQYIKEKNDWNEVVVKTNPESNMLVFGRVPASEVLNKQLNIDYPNSIDGSVFEESPKSIDYVKFISSRIAKYGGAAIFIDYGYDLEPYKRVSTQFYSTIQALRGHKYVPIFDKIGKSDITAHVDFFTIKSIASRLGLKIFGAITQREFLLNMGIEIRANELIKKNPELSEILKSQLSRLIDEKQMGKIFKVLFLSDNNI
jgi:NADH dehydrogenase [ubiquinone] 1 alpha subcomplex assembly factor 7